MKVVKNDFVDMKWDADLFVQSKTKGFVTAINAYGDTGVAFYEGMAFAMFDVESDEVFDAPGLLKEIKGYLKAKDPDFPDDIPGFALIVDGGGICASDVLLGNLNLEDDDVDDIEKRLDDLQCYWQIVEEPI